MPQSGRLRAECEEDAQPLFERRVQKRYTNEKSASRLPQYGRTLVETLGVLAIVGVLSVGAFSGYTKLNNIHKTHQQIKQLNTLFETAVNNLDSLKTNHRTQTVTHNNFTRSLIRLGQVPREMYKTTYDTSIYDPFGRRLIFNSHTTEIDSSVVVKNGYIGLLAYFYPSTQTLLACKNTYIVAKSWSKKIVSVSIQVSGGESPVYYGDKYCTGSLNCLKDLTDTQMQDTCEAFLTNPAKQYLQVIRFWTKA